MASDTSLNHAKEILSGCLFIPKEMIGDDDDIASLGDLDSLTFELIVMEIERLLKQEVDPIKLLEMQSVRDLAAMLEHETA